MELHELHIRDHGTGTQGQGHPIAGGDVRIGRLPEDLPETTRCQHHIRCQNGADSITFTTGHAVHGDSLRCALGIHQQIQNQGVLEDLDSGVTCHRRDESPGDLSAGCITTGVCDPILVVSTLTAEGELTGGQRIELCSPGHQFANRLRALFHQDAHGIDIAQTHASDEGVGQMLLG